MSSGLRLFRFSHMSLVIHGEWCRFTPLGYSLQLIFPIHCFFISLPTLPHTSVHLITVMGSRSKEILAFSGYSRPLRFTKFADGSFYILIVSMSLFLTIFSAMPYFQQLKMSFHHLLCCIHKIQENRLGQ